MTGARRHVGGDAPARGRDRRRARACASSTRATCPGRVGRWENTWCPGCGALLIERYGFRILRNVIPDGDCPDCGAPRPRLLGARRGGAVAAGRLDAGILPARAGHRTGDAYPASLAKERSMFNIRAWGPALLLLALFIAVLLHAREGHHSLQVPGRPHPGRQRPAAHPEHRRHALRHDPRPAGADRQGPAAGSRPSCPCSCSWPTSRASPLETIVALRRTQRLDWIEVMRKSDIKLNVLFEGVEGRFPEPYKASWTEWRMKYRPELTDDQIRELVFLQLAHSISGRPMAELVKTPTLPMEVLALGKPKPKPAAAKEKAAEKAEPPAPKKKPADKPARQAHRPLTAR